MNYRSNIGRYKEFPVNQVLAVIQRHWLAKLVGLHSSVLLNTGLRFNFTKAEAAKLEQELSNYRETVKLSAMVATQQSANRPS